MCKDKATCIHNRVTGRYAVQAYLAGKERRNLCAARVTYLKRQMDTFAKSVDDFDEVYWDTGMWLQALWTEDQIETDMEDDISLNTVKTAPSGYMLGEDKETLDIIPIRIPYYNVHDKLEGMFINHTIKATSKYWKEKRYQWVKTAIELEDKIIEALKPINEVYVRDGKLPYNTWKLLKKYRTRINDLRFNLGDSVLRFKKRKIEKEGFITYTQWAMLSNWINRMLGNKKRYDYNHDEDLHQLLEDNLDSILGDGKHHGNYEDKRQDKGLANLEEQRASEEAVRLASRLADEEMVMWQEWKRVGYRVK